VDDVITDFLPTMKTVITPHLWGKTLIIDAKYYGRTKISSFLKWIDLEVSNPSGL
jgi:hypothetical protein